MTLVHHLLNRHTLMEKDGAVIVLCGHRWSRHVSVWFQPAPGMLWEEADDVDALLARISGP